ncbi:MAG: ABC transporter substrate-binding protein [Azospirillaceae bacterium]|nr:ABC transporter substrate-binding protein [Azospirillaceae bacterium]
MRRRNFLCLAVCVALLGLAATNIRPVAAAEPTEVIHWWTSGGESAALKVLVQAFTADGGIWVDSPVATGDAAKTVARTRLFGGEPPQAMMWQPGRQLLAMAGEGVLADLTPVAVAGNWDGVLPPLLQAAIKLDGKYYAVPTDIHGLNWLWASKAVFDKIGAPVPTTWEAFNQLAPKIKAAGYIPLALGGQAWQETLLFFDVALGVGGEDYYRRAFVQQDQAALDSDTLVAIFSQFKKLKEWVDPASQGRDWNLTANLIMSDKAALFIMGDWAKGEFVNAGKVPGKDYICQLAPGTADTYLFSADVWAMPRGKQGNTLSDGQKLLAEVMMKPALQEKLSLVKGSIPPRSDVPTDKFDACAQVAIHQVTRNQDHMLPAADVALPSAVVQAITDTATQFFNSDTTPAMGATQLRKAIEQAAD